MEDEDKVYYLKLKADYHSNNSDFVESETKETAINNAKITYDQAFKIAKDRLHISNSTHLGLALNLSVFYYHKLGEKELACEIADEVFEEILKEFDELKKKMQKILY